MREMIQTNKDAFAFLIEQLQLNIGTSIPTGKRYISTDGIEKEWLKELKFIDELQILPSFSALLLEFASEKYIITIGLDIDDSQLDTNILQPVDINAGILTVLLAERKVKFHDNIEYLEFYNEIMFQHLDSAYVGHDYLDFEKFLQPISIFKLPVRSILEKGSINRVLCYIFSKDSRSLILDFETNLLDTISELSLVGSDKITFGLVLNSLFSTSYKHAFLELYRLVERLFPVSYLKDFHNEVNTELPFLQFSAVLENITSWRPREDDAIEKLFSETKSTTNSIFTSFIGTLSSNSGINIHNYFYKLRNSIVHFRANHEEFELNGHQWNLLLTGTIYLIDEHYSLHHALLI